MTEVLWVQSGFDDIMPDANGSNRNIVPRGTGNVGTPNARWNEAHLGYLKVYGDADIQGYLQVEANLNASSLGITGSGTFGGSINCANVNATGNIDGYNIHAANNLTCNGTLTTDGNATVNGVLTITASANISTNLSVGGQVLSSLIPQSTSNNLGSSSNRWGTAYVNNLDVPSLTLGSLTVTGNVTLNGQTYTFPGSSGQSGQALVTNGSGTLSWASSHRRKIRHSPVSIRNGRNIGRKRSENRRVWQHLRCRR